MRASAENLSKHRFRACAWLLSPFCTLIFVVSLASLSHAQDLETTSEEFFYFNPDGRGAHAFYTPTSMIIEGGFSAIGKKTLHEFRYTRGFESLWSSLSNPFAAVKQHGWKQFIYGEFIPNPGLDTGQWVPNWTWHLVGNGFRTRQLTEYFIHHGAEYPRVQAWLVAYTSHLLNEVVQAEKYADRSVDSIADLFFFDWIGKLVYEIEAVNRFSRDILHLKDWTIQSVWNPFTNSLINVGQLYWFRIHLFGPWSVGAITGELTNTVNVTYAWGQADQFTLGFGVKPRAIVLGDKNDAVADGIHLTLGAYYSKNDNPVFTATVETNTIFDLSTLALGSEDNYDEELAFVFNIYPGWFDIFSKDLGLTMAMQDEAVWLGVTYGASPVGFALGSQVFER